MNKSDAEYCPICCFEMAKALHRCAHTPFDDDDWFEENPLRLFK